MTRRLTQPGPWRSTGHGGHRGTRRAPRRRVAAPVRGGAPQAHAGRRRRPVPRAARASTATSTPTRGSSPGFTRDPDRRGDRRRDRRRRLGRHDDGRLPAQAGRHDLPHHRQGRRLRRHLVLEPLPRLHVRRRVVHATCRCSRRAGYMPTHKYAHASEIFEYAQQLGRHFDMYPHALFQTEVTDMVWDERPTAGSSPRRRDDRIAARFVVICGGVLHKAKLPGDPRHRDLRGPLVPHQPVGLRATPAAAPRSRWTSCTTRSSPSSGTGATAVQAVPKLAEAARAPVRVPAHAVVGQRPQPAATPTPSGSREMSSKPGWQIERIANFIAMTTGEQPAGRPGPRRVDRAVRASTRRSRRRTTPRRAELELLDFQLMEGIRCARDRRDRRGPGHRGGAEALVQGQLQAALLPRRLPADVQPPQRHARRHRRAAASTGSRPGGSSSASAEYPVELHRLRVGLRDASTFYTHRLGFDPRRQRRRVAVGGLGARARGRCTASTPTASRTCA